MSGGALAQQLVAAFADLARSVAREAPRALLLIALALLAWLAAKAVERLLRRVLVRLRLDGGAQRVGLDQAAARLGLRQPPSVLLPRAAYYLLLFLLARTAADGLGLTAISSAIGAFLAYLPSLVAALLILVAGSLGAPALGAAVTRAAAGAGIEYGSSLGRLVSALVLLVAGIMAVGQLRIDTDILRIVTTCILASLGLAFGLSLGLGTREITRDMIAGFYARKLFEPGRRLEVGGEQGVLRAITPTQVLLDQGDRLVAVSNRAFLDGVVRQDAPPPAA